MWVARGDDGYVFGGLTPVCVETLRGVPMLIESTDERVRARLLPDTYSSAGDEAQWREHATPELERLFLSRAQLVRRDLAGLRRIKDLDSFVLEIPDQHSNAWLSSLNAARLALYALNDLQPEHLDRDGITRATPKQQEALLRIHFLAELQSVLLGDIDLDDAEDPPAGSG
jgi:hypothetical protein